MKIDFKGEIKMIIKTYKELKEYLKDTNITISVYSEQSIFQFPKSNWETHYLY